MGRSTSSSDIFDHFVQISNILSCRQAFWGSGVKGLMGTIWANFISIWTMCEQKKLPSLSSFPDIKWCVSPCVGAFFLYVSVMSAGPKWNHIWSCAIWLCPVLLCSPWAAILIKHPHTAGLLQQCAMRHRFLAHFEFRPDFEQRNYPDSPEVSPELPVRTGSICKSQLCHSPRVSFCLSPGLKVFKSSVQRGLSNKPSCSISDSSKPAAEGSLINQS